MKGNGKYKVKIECVDGGAALLMRVGGASIVLEPGASVEWLVSPEHVVTLEKVDGVHRGPRGQHE